MLKDVRITLVLACGDLTGGKQQIPPLRCGMTNKKSKYKCGDSSVAQNDGVEGVCDDEAVVSQ
jgi:hypothetical protein